MPYPPPPHFSFCLHLRAGALGLSPQRQTPLRTWTLPIPPTYSASPLLRAGGLGLSPQKQTPLRPQPPSLGGAVHGTTICEDEAVHFESGNNNVQEGGGGSEDGDGDGEEGDVEDGKGRGGDGAFGRGMPQMLPEYRMRLLTGLKQYYRGKYEEGVLGAKVGGGAGREGTTWVGV